MNTNVFKGLLLFLLFWSFDGHSQLSHEYSYLIIEFRLKHNHEARESYYVISPEGGNPNANFIHELIPYNSKSKSQNTAVFNVPPADSTQNVYNYFRSVSGALQYLDAKGWKLFTVVNNVSGSNGITSTTNSYYLRKKKD